MKRFFAFLTLCSLVLTTSYASTDTDSRIDLNGYFSCDDGGHYYVRQVEKYVYWYGEDPNGNWANVFRGKLSKGKIKGSFYDVPKGKIKGQGVLKLEVGKDGVSFQKLEGDNFGGRRWTKSTRPNNLPRKQKAGFSAIGDSNKMDGTWTCNDGGRYYVSQFGNTTVWFGESKFDKKGVPYFANIAFGIKRGKFMHLNWVDVPKCNHKGKGKLVLTLKHANRFVKHSGEGFGGSEWWRGDGKAPEVAASINPAPNPTPSPDPAPAPVEVDENEDILVEVTLELVELYCEREDDGSGSAEELFGSFYYGASGRVTASGFLMKEGQRTLWSASGDFPIELKQREGHTINKREVFLFPKENVTEGTNARIYISGKLEEKDGAFDSDDDLGRQYEMHYISEIMAAPSSKIYRLGTFTHDDTRVHFKYKFTVREIRR